MQQIIPQVDWENNIRKWHSNLGEDFVVTLQKNSVWFPMKTIVSRIYHVKYVISIGNCFRLLAFITKLVVLKDLLCSLMKTKNTTIMTGYHLVSPTIKSSSMSAAKYAITGMCRTEAKEILLTLQISCSYNNNNHDD